MTLSPTLPCPERTCIGCRRRAPVTELARLALSSEGRVVAWGAASSRPAGRGASLHASAHCLRAALKAGAFARAFRRQVQLGNNLGDEDESNFLQQLTAATAALRSENRNKP